MLGTYNDIFRVMKNKTMDMAHTGNTPRLTDHVILQLWCTQWWWHIQGWVYTLSSSVPRILSAGGWGIRNMKYKPT